MKTLLLLLALASRFAFAPAPDLPLVGELFETTPAGESAPAITFAAFEIIVDSGDEPLAAYQLEIRALAGSVRIVGIEGGEHPEFADAPYYDTAAMQGERVIIAAFSTRAADALPRGATRVATMHVQITGDAPPRFEETLHVAATVDGREIDATVTTKRGSNP